jgi:hypothetical protein
MHHKSDAIAQDIALDAVFRGQIVSRVYAEFAAYDNITVFFAYYLATCDTAA